MAATVSILSPINETTILVGPPAFAASLTLTGTGSASIKTFEWYDSGIAGFLGSGDRTTASLPLEATSHSCVKEPHTITLRGVTATGEIATASVNILLVTNCIS